MVTSACIVSSMWDTSSNGKHLIYKSRDSVRLFVRISGSSYIDTDSEQQEEDPKAHEEWGYQGPEELFVGITSVLCGANLINKEPGTKEHASGHQHTCQWPSAPWPDGGRQPYSLAWCISSWLQAPIFQVQS